MRLDHLFIRGLVCALTLALGIPGAKALRKWPDPPGWWLQAATCIHRYESPDWHQRGWLYSGGYQFMDSSWQAVGGHGRAADATVAEQTWRAWLLYLEAGWAAWPNTSRICGLR